MLATLEACPMNMPPATHRRMNPEALGPLGDRPLASRPAGAGELFPGATTFLAARHQKKRLLQWAAVRPIVEKMLRPDEQLLYVAHAMQMPPTFDALALGAYALPFHQVVLALTDSRMIEVMLDLRGRAAGTRVRSFAWSGVRALKMGWGRFTLTPAAGKKQAWRVPLRGDRKILEALHARLKPRLLTEGAAHAGQVPLWHCPQCVAVVPREPESCVSCRTRFRSKRLASLLSIAFPGAGLFYAGHPFLATMDFLGELLLYGLFVLMILFGDAETLPLSFGFAALLLFMTKFESVHLSRIFASRSRPESEGRRAGFAKFATIGGLVSVLLIGGTLPLTGKARPVLERDLDHAAADGWHGSRDRSEWPVFGQDATARSQWVHDTGLRVTLFAYKQTFLATPGMFRDRLRQEFAQQNETLVVDDEDIPAPFQGFRMITSATADSGEAIRVINYFVVDAANNDVHQAVAAVIAEDGEVAEKMVRDFLSGSQLVPAIAVTGAPTGDATAEPAATADPAAPVEPSAPVEPAAPAAD